MQGTGEVQEHDEAGLTLVEFLAGPLVSPQCQLQHAGNAQVIVIVAKSIYLI